MFLQTFLGDLLQILLTEYLDRLDMSEVWWYLLSIYLSMGLSYIGFVRYYSACRKICFITHFRKLLILINTFSTWSSLVSEVQVQSKLNMLVKTRVFKVPFFRLSGEHAFEFKSTSLFSSSLYAGVIIFLLMLLLTGIWESNPYDSVVYSSFTKHMIKNCIEIFYLFVKIPGLELSTSKLW